jgi:hypothetical protein
VAIFSMVLTLWTLVQFVLTQKFPPLVADLQFAFLPPHFPIPHALFIPPIVALLLAIGGHFGGSRDYSPPPGRAHPGRRALIASGLALAMVIGYPCMMIGIWIIVLEWTGTRNWRG